MVKGWHVAVVLAASAATMAASAEGQTKSPQDGQIKAEVQRQLSKVDASASRLTIDVRDGVVTLSGGVATLWVKQEAVKRVLKMDGVHSLMADLTIAKAENDATLLRQVGDAIRHYDLYTVYDNIEGRVRNGASRSRGRSPSRSIVGHPRTRGQGARCPGHRQRHRRPAGIAERRPPACRPLPRRSIATRHFKTTRWWIRRFM